MIDGATSIFHALLDGLKVLGLMMMGIIMWRGNSAHAADGHIDHDAIVNTAKHTTDAVGVGVAAVAVADKAGVISWLDLINSYMQSGIILLTLVWMVYRIIEMRVNIKAKQKSADDKD